MLFPEYSNVRLASHEDTVTYSVKFIWRNGETIDISDIRQVRVELQQENTRDGEESVALLEKVLVVANR